jgi:predicted dehydrogenase
MTLSIGVLGAARIVKSALLDPAREVAGIEVTAVAARDVTRAAEWAREHGVATVHRSYDDLIEDDAVDAVYIPTPAALHGHWMRRVLKAGKHVLCEKPFTANAQEAASIAELVEPGGPVVMEAFHSRHHPMWDRMAELVESGVLGRPVSARAEFSVPHSDTADIRWQRHLGGGALMDLGCYPVRLLRHLFGEPEVIGAEAHDVDGVDASMTAKLDFSGGVIGDVVASMETPESHVAELRVTGTAGEMHVRMPYHPQYHGELTVTTPTSTVVESGAGGRSTYVCQLEAFRDAVVDRAPNLTDAREATAAMSVIDAIYRAAGMSPREPLSPGQ